MTTEEFEKLSELVQKRLALPAFNEALEKIVDQYDLGYKGDLKLLQFAEDLLLKKITLSDVGEKIKQELSLDETKTKAVLLDFLGLMLWFQDELGDVVSLIKKNQGDQDKYYNQAVAALVPENIFWDDLTGLISEGNIKISNINQQQKKNFVNILLSVLYGVIQKDEISELLQKPETNGGLGVSTEQAENIAAAISTVIYEKIINPEMFSELDEIRRQVLGKRFTSILKDFEGESGVAKIKFSVRLNDSINKFINLPEVHEILQKLSQVEDEIDYSSVKDQFYEAINSKNRLSFVTNLVILFNSGRVKDLFTNDERYVKFWRNRVLKDKGLEGIRKFDENPLRREQFGGFIKHVLEERFEIPTGDAVLWGVFLSSLAHRANDTDYDRLAYGDLADQQFKWNI